MKNTPEAYPLKDFTFQWVSFHQTNIWKWGLWNVLDSINEGSNIWIDTDGKSMREWMAVYNKELLPWILVIAFDTEEARNTQFKVNESLEWKDTWKYTLPDITTFFEIEKEGRKVYCYVVDRMDMWKHKKDMLMWEIDNISIDWMIVYPSWFLGADWEIIQVRDDVSGILSTGKNF